MASKNVAEALEKACLEMQELNFQATNRDRSLAAFESFRRAVVFLMRAGTTSERRKAVDDIEAKSQVLQFLLDVADRHSVYRSRTAEVMKALQNSSSWSASMETLPEVYAGIQGIVHQSKGVVCKDLEKAAAVAKAEGDLGVLSVKVMGARNLMVKSDNSTKLCAKVCLGERTSSTVAVRCSPEPRWNTEEFVFDVGVSDWLVKFEVCQKVGEDVVHVGKLAMPLGDILTHQGPVTLCRSFEDVPNGELEFVLQYVSGSATEPETVREETAMHQSYPSTPAASAKETPWSCAPTSAPANLTAQQLGKLWASPVEGVPTPQKAKPMLPVLPKTDAGAATKRAAGSADPWSSPKASKTPKTADAVTPSKHGVSPATRAAKAKAASNPFRTSASPRFQQGKASNPFKGEKKDSSVGKKLQKAFDNLWA